MGAHFYRRQAGERKLFRVAVRSAQGSGVRAQKASSTRKGPSNPATEQVENRAYPRAYVDDRPALKSHDAFDREPEKLGSAALGTRTAFVASLAASPGAWSALGPVTPNISGEASQFLDPVTLQGPTAQESGRVYGLTLSQSAHVLYAATHGRGAYALSLPTS